MRMSVALRIVALGLPLYFVASPVAAEPDTAYLMAYFGPDEKLFYAWSRDARSWTALNGGEPVLDAGVRLRDPFLQRVKRGRPPISSNSRRSMSRRFPGQNTAASFPFRRPSCGACAKTYGDPRATAILRAGEPRDE